mmetsp:Transcript_4270/g.12308  ORF Transcript_4270/g.12308 Transcript_4270/m.12308 type:complete len:124 (-) Transcript_4270:309-680(-)
MVGGPCGAPRHLEITDCDSRGKQMGDAEVFMRTSRLIGVDHIQPCQRWIGLLRSDVDVVRISGRKLAFWMQLADESCACCVTDMGLASTDCSGLEGAAHYRRRQMSEAAKRLTSVVACHGPRR